MVLCRLPSYRTGNSGTCMLIISMPCSTKGGFCGQIGSLLHQEMSLHTSVVAVIIDWALKINLIILVHCNQNCSLLLEWLLYSVLSLLKHISHQQCNHFKLLFGVTTCTAHPLSALPTTMVCWDRHALDALVTNLRLLRVCSICCCSGSAASMCSSC